MSIKEGNNSKIENSKEEESSSSEEEETQNDQTNTSPNKSSKKYTCDRCNKTLRSRFKFLDHLFNHDNSVKPYECPVCGIRLGYSTSVTRHLQMHLRDIGCLATDKKSFLCPRFVSRFFQSL